MNDRPSWGHMPEDYSFRAYGWRDRIRVVLIVLGVIAVCLAGSVEL